MRAGLLREVITVLKPSITVNEVGEQTTTYVPHITTKARLQHLGSTRDIENTEILFQNLNIFTIRDYHEIKDTYRIEYKSRFYRILKIQEEPEHRQIVIHTELIND
jgi:head-tail adaptor